MNVLIAAGRSTDTSTSLYGRKLYKQTRGKEDLSEHKQAVLNLAKPTPRKQQNTVNRPSFVAHKTQADRSRYRVTGIKDLIRVLAVHDAMT